MRLAFLGIGSMGSALARGVIDSGFSEAGKIYAYDPDQDRLKSVVDKLGILSCPTAEEAVRQGDIVVVCVKPQILPTVFEEIAGAAGTASFFVSIAAGISIGQLESLLPRGAAVARCMPNTAVRVGVGASAISFNSRISEEQKRLTLGLFGSVGIALEVDEKLMDAVTGVSGSGPAFIYTVIEAMADAGVSLGLTREVALKLAAQTALGAAKMIIETGDHPASLRDRVTSPGGTTIAGIVELERSGGRAAIINAVQAAARRSAELGK